jgi:nucleotide-binding universal stress UspA family protein
LVAEADVLEGPTAETIINHAHSGGFGLIVMGTRRRGRLQSAILGSVSAGVAAHSSVPVMIVPEPALRDMHDDIE